MIASMKSMWAPMASTMGVGPPADDGADWLDFKAGYEQRLLGVQYDFPVLPPKFTMPRFRGEADWRAIQNPPLLWQIGAERDLGNANGKKPKGAEAQVISPERLGEMRVLALCRKEMLNRTVSADRSFVRTYGCQLFLVFCVIVGLICDYFRIDKAHRILGLLHICMANYALLLVSIINWMKGVKKCSEALFVWLGETYERVQHSGEVIAQKARFQLLTRILGMVHCENEPFCELVERLDWEDGFQKELPNYLANFTEAMFLEDDTVETEAMFVDEYGILNRFVWELEAAGSSGGKINTRTRCLEDFNDLSDYAEPDNEVWCGRSLDYFIDVLGDDISTIVARHPWWAKFEFQLRAEQSKIGGFRSYLGARVFNSEWRFFCCYCFVPLFIIVCCTMYRVFMTTHDPAIRLVFLKLSFRVAETCGFNLGILYISWSIIQPKFGAWFLNVVMWKLETWVNKDWGTIMDIYQVEENYDAEDAYKLGQQELAVTNDITKLWRVVTSDACIEAIARDIYASIIKSPTRKIAWTAKSFMPEAMR